MKTSRALFILLCTSLALLLRAAPAGAQADAQVPSSCGPENLIAGKSPVDPKDVRGDVGLLTDGAIAAEGADWNAPAAVIFRDGTGALTYDLGEAREVRAVYLQADANDTYKVLGSVDGTPQSYRLLVELANVVERGHGLRTRAAEIDAKSVRYLRVEVGRGDGSASITEFGAYCRTPAPFPPALKTAATPGPQPASGPSSEAEDEGPGNRTVLLLIAAAVALFGSTGALNKKRTKPAASRERKKQRGAKAEATPEKSDRVGPRSSVHEFLMVMFLASGSAALIYEVVWVHLLRLVIGASALSVGIVLASFMGGMFLGSLLFARFVPVTKHPLRVYGLLEIGIGVFGLMMPLVLPGVRSIYVGLFGYGAAGIALRALIAALLLLPPTALMGATLPAIARRYSPGRRGMSALASLYAANTVGAVVGSLLSAFYLLASWDVWVATATAAALNFAVGWGALRVARLAPAEGPAKAAPAARAAAGDPRLVQAVYVVTALSGFTALGAQVTWTRLLTLLFGATVYAFAIILAVFLSGLGIGSALSARLLRRGTNPFQGLAWAQVALVPTLLIAGYLLAKVLPYMSPPALTPVRALHTLHVLRAALIILPSAILWGMSFPFGLAAAARGAADTGRSSGLVYAANTIGAIAGALAISFIAIPRYGTRWAEQSLVVVASLAAALLFFRIKRAPGKLAAGDTFLLPPAWALAVGIFAAALLPGLSHAFLAHGSYIWWVNPRDKYPYVKEGAASTVAVHVAPDGFRNFHVSGRVEASSNPNDMRLQRLLGHLSALNHPAPESVLVVGLGAGVTAGTFVLYPEIKRIVICEIEPRVVGAAEQFAPENYGVLADPRVEMVFDDARHFLATTHERFDIITSDPIHPWVRGNSILFSHEYYSIVQSKLKPGGIATQWVPLYETSEEAIKLQMHTFMETFVNGTVWNSAVSGRGYDVVLLGRLEPLRLDLAAIQSRIDRNPRVGESLRDVKVRSVVDLVATYAASAGDMKEWLAGTPINRDFSLKLEYISALSLNRDEADKSYSNMIAGRKYPNELFDAPPRMEAELRRRIASNEVVGDTR